ncbi:unnamed protein product [Candidula unifasciata]|uniref:Uridine diphosphate glucose pyrophosphatase NUDT14 n=1 Tax=Candidula unifasciata TaxID=100452 RepID=A0A8S3ZQB2_9EUPU|nr:unnamed protein product [Candidula unifasciata]
MEKITDVTVGPCECSKYIKPKRIHYKQNGVEKIWDAMKVHDGVACLLFNTTRRVFIFVRQFRPAIYINSVATEVRDGVETVDTNKYPASLGMTIELCAGIIDRDEPPQNIAKSEISEECGYDVPLEHIRKVTSCRSGVGTAGGTLHIFYAEVTDEMKVGPGGGNPHEGEMIEVVEMSIEEGRKLILDETVNRVHGLLFALLWFFENISYKDS